MGRTGAYLEITRKPHSYRNAADSIGDHEDIVIPLDEASQKDQASRCMNCGVAFCQSGGVFEGSGHAVGCPLQNLIPETNDLLCKGRLDDAAERLSLTNPFPEFTGRVCPAPCESACNLGLNDEPVTICDNERLLSDHAWRKGMRPLEAPSADARVVSVIGSGPAGLACAWELCRSGHRVRVYEKNDRAGGLLMYGIPNMKLPKQVVDRRIDLMRESGIEFIVGSDAADAVSDIAKESDAVVLAIGCGVARDMDIEGRGLEGVHFALDYLSEATKAHLEGREPKIDASGKDVVVIGGGDTATDCLACALRQGARSVAQVTRAHRPPESCPSNGVWPLPRKVYSKDYGHRESEEVFGKDPRIWGTDTVAFLGDGSVEAVMVEKIGSDVPAESIPAQLVLIAKGFIGPEPAVCEAFGIDASAMEEDGLLSSGSDGMPPVFSCGDAKMGSTLVASAIADGIACAEQVRSALY